MITVYTSDDSVCVCREGNEVEILFKGYTIPPLKGYYYISAGGLFDMLNNVSHEGGIEYKEITNEEMENLTSK